MREPDTDQEVRDADRFVPARWVVSERVGEEGILNDQREGQIHVLNASATRVWEMCVRRLPVGELVDGLAASYGKPPAAVREDVHAVLRDFLARGLVDRAG